MWWQRPTRVDGWTAREVQAILRRFGEEARDIASVMAAFGVDQREAHEILNTLYRACYVVRDPAGENILRWRRTREGDAFADMCLGPPLSRAQADRLLQGVLRRVVTVNRQPYFLCHVAAVGVCGSYLTAAPILDELELVVRLVPKPPAPGTADTVLRPARRLPYWHLQKWLPPREWLHWRELHVESYLVAGHRNLVLRRSNDPRLRRQYVQMVFPRA